MASLDPGLQVETPDCDPPVTTSQARTVLPLPPAVVASGVLVNGAGALEQPASVLDRVVMARRNVNLRMDDGARSSWRSYCTKQGVTLTALIDALGYELERNPKLIPPRVIDKAREIANERNAR